MFRNSYFLVLLIALSQCTIKAEEGSGKIEKIDGISVEASRQLIDSTDLRPISDLGAKWVALMPYAFIRKEEGVVHFNSPRQWVGERVEGIQKDIETCHEQGLKVMLKPHVWVSRGGYTGDYIPETWDSLEISYSSYIITFAKLAQKNKVELFCMGTEWRRFVKERPKYWNSLIDSVRKIYSGKLTYAANWDEYKETPFWNKLDYIGVNAYFPLTEVANPTNEALEKAWMPISNNLETISYTVGKPVLFTEYGYRSVEGTTIEPWESYTDLQESMAEQQNALSSLYASVWNKKWMAGGFLWKWHMQESRWGNRNLDYTPQGKPALEVIKKWYRQD